MVDHCPCPFCRAQLASKVRFTPWGGVIGPKLLNLVKCNDCGKQYNGKSGTAVDKAVRAYSLCSLLLLTVMVAFVIRSYVGGSKPAHTGYSYANPVALTASPLPPACC